VGGWVEVACWCEGASADREHGCWGRRGGCITYADTPYFFAISCCASTSTLQNCSLPGFVSFSARPLNTGAIALQGPHQSA
jgi:hypothetical protein